MASRLELSCGCSVRATVVDVLQPVLTPTQSQL